ncbi:contractile injection system tape measure protein [Algibacter sp.]|uniref:contractile injection system tape measure protein n=1 Tax=Algibacter sp. TaxID=1872428 RepID=UPI003C744855
MASHESTDEDAFNLIGSEIVIRNAGMVILWPFFTRLFEELSFLENNEFADNESRNRSVYLLQQLVYNRIDFLEYELLLNKLFVGLPLTNHLSPISEISIEEIDLCSSLLHGLMFNWDKVKISSPEAVQETYLQRDGFLKIKEDAITLRIEKKGVDVLLNSLSWNISLIKLGWMEKPLYVEWI